MGSGEGGQRERGRGRLGDTNRKQRREDTFVSPLIKWLMFSFNMFFWIVSWVLIAVGIWAYLETQEFKTVDQEEGVDIFDIFFDFSILFIVFGVIVFILAFFGAIGALRENVVLLKIFAALLLVIFLCEVGIMIAVFAFSNKIKTELQDLLADEAIRDYRDDINRQNIIDWFQETFECCGVAPDGYQAWEGNKYFNCSSPGFEACSVPYSCCKDPFTFDAEVANTRCGAGMLEPTLTSSDVSNTIWTTGCVEAAIQSAQDNIFLLGGVGLGIVIPQLVGIFLAKVLWGQINDQRARWGSR